MNDLLMELERLGVRQIDVIAPHPDDEVFAVGATMMLAQDAGIAVRVIAVTDGESSHRSSKLVTPDEIARRRQAEIQAAYRCLAISPWRVRLGLQDGFVTREDVEQCLIDLREEASAIIAPLPDDGHQDHNACGAAAVALAETARCPAFFYPVWTAFRTPVSSSICMSRWVTLCDERLLSSKRRAIDCFQSQLGALGPLPEDGPVLPEGFAATFLTSRETFFSP